MCALLPTTEPQHVTTYCQCSTQQLSVSNYKSATCTVHQGMRTGHVTTNTHFANLAQKVQHQQEARTSSLQMHTAQMHTAACVAGFGRHTNPAAPTCAGWHGALPTLKRDTPDISLWCSATVVTTMKHCSRRLGSVQHHPLPCHDWCPTWRLHTHIVLVTKQTLPALAAACTCRDATPAARY